MVLSFLLPILGAEIVLLGAAIKREQEKKKKKKINTDEVVRMGWM